MGDAKIGLIGLAVMGQNLVLNMADHGFNVAVFNRTWERTEAFMNGLAKGHKNIVAGKTMQEFVNLLAKPRQVMFMVKAGQPVDDMIAQVKGYLEPGDLLIDGGNEYYKNTERRWKQLEAEGFRYIGTGVSGGEEGARRGPAIMPGGSESSYAGVKPIFEAISAKVGPKNEPCVIYFGPGGAGHYVKMVHNGIEYGDMQLIAEAYDILQRTLGLKAPELHEIFKEWNEKELSSYLIEITRDIFAKQDDQGGKKWQVDTILDEAHQKGTGKWTSQDALDLGIPIPTINAAVVARMLSAIKDERVKASKVLPGPKARYKGSKQKMINAVRAALYTSKICSYAQGMSLIRSASKENKWGVNLGDCAKVWRGGCIIRSVFLEDIRKAFARNAELPNLLLDPFFKKAVTQRLPQWRFVVSTAVQLGIPVPAFGDSLAYYDGYRSARLPTNLTQAQRDYFGAHTYRRVDKKGVFHTEWMK
jgi:6-phosphogluconate dehydrogenase